METKVTFKVVCGCGAIFQTTEVVRIPTTLKEAWIHADIERHTMEIRGEIRAEKPVVHYEEGTRPSYRPERGLE